MQSHVNPTDLGRLEDRSLDNRFEIDRTRLESDARRRDNTWFLSSIGLLVQGVIGLRSWTLIHAIAASMLIWGKGILAYFARFLWDVKGVRPHGQVS